MRLDRLKVLGPLLFALAATASAQSWQGSAALGVEVNDQRGRDLPGARVEIRYRDGDGGPGTLLTDGNGRAAFVGLAPGAWSVEVSHPGNLSYVAAVLLQPGKKAEVTASFLQATGTGREPLRVKLFKARAPAGSPAPAPASVPAARSPAPAAQETAPSAQPEPESPPAAAPPPEVESAAVAASPPSPPAAPPEEAAAPEPIPAAKPPAVSPESVAETSEEPTPEAPSGPPSGPAPALPADPVTPPRAPQPEPTPRPDSRTPPSPPASEPPAAEAPATETPPPAPAPEAAAAATPPPPSPQPKPPTPPRAEPAPTAVPAVPTVPPDLEPEPPVVEPAVSPPAAPIPSPAPASPTPSPTPPPPVTGPAPAAEPAPQSPPEAPAPAATPEPPAPRPEPTALPPAAAPAPTTPSPPASPAPPLRSYSQRSCAECKPGEWAATARLVLPPGSGCPEGADLDAKPVLERLASAGAAGLDGFAGQAAGPIRPSALGLLPNAERTELETVWASLGADSCRPAAVALPAGARFVGFRFEAGEVAGRGDSADCLAGEECPAGSAYWAFNPKIVRGSDLTVVYSVFENRSSEAPRTGRLVVYFVPPSSSWRPTP